MDNKTDLMDLRREKQELDQFLSTIAGSEIVDSMEMRPASVQKPAEPQKPFEETEEIPRPRPLVSVEKTEDVLHRVLQKEKPPVKPIHEDIPVNADVIPIRPIADLDLKPKVTSSFLPGDEEKNEQPLPRIPGMPVRKPQEDQGVMTHFGETSILGEQEAKGDVKKAQKASPVPYDYAPPKAKISAGKFIGILLIVVIAMAAAAIFLFGDVVKTYIPGSASVIDAGKRLIPSDASDVNLANVRQRLVFNNKIGKSIRVIEGIVENVSGQTISNIKVSATLYDSAGSKLATMDTFGGNIIIDEKLESFDANAIQTALQTGKGAADKIPPKGQIPFMIVFVNEPAGVFKMSVMAVDMVKQ